MAVLNCAKLLILTSLICVVLMAVSPAEAKRKHGRKRDNNNSLLSTPEWKARRNKNSECRLGGNRYALNATWSPDLGPPFGIWNCVRCTCTAVRKKRRIVARVICKNIKKQCPIAHCDNPVLAPGACCKLCPGQKLNLKDDFVGMQRHEAAADDKELSGKDFAVLLNGRTSNDPVTTSNLATGRIFLRRGTLHFSFVLDSGTPPPSIIQFMGADGNILEEMEAQPTPYEVNNGRVCGTWTRVPHQYRTLLKKEQMWVALVPPGDKDIISGQVRRYRGVNTEVFSSLLSPMVKKRDMPGGGTAIISVSAPSDSLHVSLVFNGIFKKNEYRNITVYIELTPSRALDAVTETIFLQKAFSDINEAHVMTTLGETSLRLLTRGKVSLKVWSAESPELAIEGAVIARATCNVYSSVLTSAPRPGMQSYGAGWALLFVSNDGDFEYQIKLDGLPSAVTSVIFETTSKRKVRQVEDLTSNYKDGWVNGTYGKPTYRDLDMLLRRRLDVSVSLEGGDILLGSFEAISVTEALRTMYPTLLRSPSFWMAATAWVAVDSACVMHYDVYLAGSNPSGAGDPTWNLLLKENDTTWDPRLEQSNVTLEHIITGRDVAAHTTLLTKISLTRLLHGVTSLELYISDSYQVFHPSRMISGVMQSVHVPDHCHIGDGSRHDADTRKAPQCLGFLCMLDEEQDDSHVNSKKCIDDAKTVYEDGETWRSPRSKCHRCMCTLGKMWCQAEPCPKAKCADPVTLPGQCCPSCPIRNAHLSERVCVMDKESHSIGSYWHPFLSPKGFNLCITCHCNISSDFKPKIQCDWIRCPELPCSESVSELVEGSCCRRCPATTPAPYIPVVKGMLSDVKRTSKNKYDQQTIDLIMANGGCLERGTSVRKNGESWQPNLSFRTTRLCITCSCKDGKLSCGKQQCKKRSKNGKNSKRKDIAKKRKSRRRKKTY